jgi:hypothetical protein
VIDDGILEPVERLLAIIRPSTAYALGDKTSQVITIADNDTVRVNFQVKASPSAFAFESDLGSAFGDRTNGLRFGWDADNTANARDRVSRCPASSTTRSIISRRTVPIASGRSNCPTGCIR